MVDQWGVSNAQTIINSARDAEVGTVIDSINNLILAGKTNRAAVIVGCAQIMAQSITQAGAADLASDMRGAILALIDGFAIRSAVEDQPDE